LHGLWDLTDSQSPLWYKSWPLYDVILNVSFP
jgi:hypothetical protein